LKNKNDKSLKTNKTFFTLPLEIYPMNTYIIHITETLLERTKNMKAVNYTPEMTAQIVDDYQAGITVETIADSIGKSVRSVRSKLVREGVYVAKPKVTARKSDEPTKKELLIELESVAPFSVDGFMGATKPAIMDLIAHFKS
jgi:hypothetical protein